MENPDSCDENDQIDPWGQNAEDHLACFSGCGKNPENPYDASGPELPDDNPSLYQ
jgi:hypothetical protein